MSADRPTHATSLKGRLLVAQPVLTDPNFDRTVVLLLEHGDEGALGVVLNRPTDLIVSEALPEWGDLASAPAVLFTGGPVEPSAVVAVARALPDHRLDHMASVLDDLGVIDLHQGPDAYIGHLRAFRAFVGYSGWVAGQLEDEIAEGGWWVLDALPEDASTTDPNELWWAVMARQSDPALARLANFPPDPTYN